MERKKTSISDDNEYPNFCELAATNSIVFDTFRKNFKYNKILEHVTKNEGQIYLDIITKNNSELLNNFEKYKLNDKIGSPVQYDYSIGIISPTTIRYVKVLNDLINEFGDLSNLEIVEIGCGYGGQCKIILETFNVKSYTLVDLNPVLKLTKKFLESSNIDTSKIVYKTMDELTNKNYDLFISNYAFTECTKDIQLEYYDKAIKETKMGYITANFINVFFNLDYLTKEELISLIPNSYTIEENPKTHENNIIIVWK
jgi:putative sugar O-methyltransferase